MNWKKFLNGAATAAISGATAAAGQSLMGDTVNLKQTGTAAGLGALVGLVNWLRQPPASKEGPAAPQA